MEALGNRSSFCNTAAAAGRLIGAYRFLGQERKAAELQSGLALIGLKVRESNPFVQESPLLLGIGLGSPFVARITALWHQFRGPVLDNFPEPPGMPVDGNIYLQQLDEQYTQDAYHSLSIEGYQVGPDLIEKVRRAEWRPESSLVDRQQRDALAARGYYESYLAVRQSLQQVFNGKNAGHVFEQDLGEWYRRLFAPCVAAGIIRQYDLFGYRRQQVYIGGSRHTPFPPEMVREAMDALFSCLKEEEQPSVRAVLGHFLFVFIHPYMDGNGRLGRFLMNLMLASGGYPWTIVRVEHRTTYLSALEQASSQGNIVPFVQFLGSELPL